MSFPFQPPVLPTILVQSVAAKAWRLLNFYERSAASLFWDPTPPSVVRTVVRVDRR
jgi:hypothetical protein